MCETHLAAADALMNLLRSSSLLLLLLSSSSLAALSSSSASRRRSESVLEEEEEEEVDGEEPLAESLEQDGKIQKLYCFIVLVATAIYLAHS